MSENPVRPRKIAIVGLGLIGGSLGLVFKSKFSGCQVLGLSRSRLKIKLALKRKAIDGGSIKPDQVLTRADIVFICTPVRSIPFWIAQAERWCRPGVVVTDVGSSKQQIVSWAEKKHFKKIKFVGSHPMAGSHQSGMDYARRDLFQDSVTFVTRTSKTDSQALKQTVALWKKISKRVVIVSPSLHDQMVAQISHTPHALATLLVLKTPKRFLPFASSGFLDTTRIAQGDPLLWRDILVSNRKFLAQRLRKYRSSLNAFLQHLEKKRSSKIYAFLKNASKIRTGLSLRRL